VRAPGTAIAVAALVLGGCAARSFEDCAVRCTAASGCPDGLACSGDGFCRAAGAGGTCAAPDIDAPPAPPDAAPVTFMASGAVQMFTVPAGATKLRIVAEGASGGDSASFRGGHGAIVETIAVVAAGDAIAIVVGEQPAVQPMGSDGCGGGGGGGTFVIRVAGAVPLAVAGGGGGASAYTAAGMSSNGGEASLTGDGGDSGAISGGTAGSGGTGDTAEGGGGGGVLSDGGDGMVADGGNSFASASTGGVNDPSESCGANRGGFGGGGGGGNDLGGGGGGYSGGAAHASIANLRSGGGGSFGVGSPTITLRTDHGDGRVVVTPGF
jgi:hypothetical protein